MTPAARLVVLAVVSVTAGVVVQTLRVRVPPDVGFATGLDEGVGNLEITRDDYTLQLRRSGEHWVFTRGAKGEVTDARMQEFLEPLRSLNGADIANVAEVSERDEEIGLGSRRLEIRIDAEDLDRRLIGIEIGEDVVGGRRAVRQQGRLSAFWADIWTDVQPLPFTDARWWLGSDQPILCVDDPAVIELSAGDDAITLTREPSAAGLAWWIGPMDTGQLVPEPDLDWVEATAWSLTRVDDAAVVPAPVPAEVEAALATPTMTIRWTPEKASVQEVAVGALADGRVVARAGTVTLLVPVDWRNSLVRLLELDGPG